MIARRPAIWSSPTTARSTTSASCARELEARGPRVPHAHRHRGRAARLRASGDRRASSASTACSRSRSGTADERELFLARDRYGIKPLYYAEPGGRSSFASEIKAMLEHPALSAQREPPAPARVLHVPEHLHRRHPVRGREAAARRPPRDARAEGSAPRGLQRYWDFRFQAGRARSVDEEYAEELDRLFAGACSASSSPTCRSAPTSAAAWTRAAITALAAQLPPVPEHLHGAAST